MTLKKVKTGDFGTLIKRIKINFESYETVFAFFVYIVCFGIKYEVIYYYDQCAQKIWLLK